MNFTPSELRECAPLTLTRSCPATMPTDTTGGFCTAFNVRRVVGAEAHRTGAACAGALRCCNAYALGAADGTRAVDCCEDTGGREGQR